MTWIKLEDNAPRHPKVAGLTDRAFRAWVSSLCYASEFLTDGHLPVAFLLTIKRTIQDELMDSGLWAVAENGSVIIHDYLGHQRDKASIRHQRERDKERQSRHRNAVTNGDGNAVINGPVTKESREEESREEKKKPIPALARVDGRFETWWSAYPKKQAKGSAFKAWRKITPSDELLGKMLEALSWQRAQPGWLKDGGQFIPNPATYLNAGSYSDEPFHTPNLSEKSLRMLQTVTGGSRS